MSDCTDPVRSHIVTAPLRNGDLSWTESPDPFIFNVLLTSFSYLTLTSTVSALSSAHTHTHGSWTNSVQSQQMKLQHINSPDRTLSFVTNKVELNWRSRRRSSATTSRRSGLLTTTGREPRHSTSLSTCNPLMLPSRSGVASREAWLILHQVSAIHRTFAFNRNRDPSTAAPPATCRVGGHGVHAHVLRVAHTLTDETKTKAMQRQPSGYNMSRVTDFGVTPRRHPFCCC